MTIGAEAQWNEEQLLQKIGDYEIFRFYIPNFKKVGEKFSSSFRKDTNPSCNITEYNGRLWFKDFGDPLQERAETCIQLITRLYGIDYQTALVKIKSDLINKRYNPIKYESIKTTKQSKSKIRIKRKEWTEDDNHYWKCYGINIDLLNKFDVIPISHFWIMKNESILYKAENLAYSFDYYWHDGIFRRKIYQPLSKENKWYSTSDITVIQGWKMLPRKGKLLVITKSLKDVITLRTVGYYAIAPNTESSFIPESVFNKLKTRWNRIIIWYDNDETGLKKAEMFSERYDIPFITTDDKEKDPSDYRKIYGEFKFLELLKQKLC